MPCGHAVHNPSSKGRQGRVAVHGRHAMNRGTELYVVTGLRFLMAWIDFDFECHAREITSATARRAAERIARADAPATAVRAVRREVDTGPCDGSCVTA